MHYWACDTQTVDSSSAYHPSFPPPLRLSLFATGGQEDTRRLDRIVHHAKSSKTSFYTVLHYAQNISDKVFGAYDWGEEGENRRRYGSGSPPLYQLARVQTETCLFWSPQDSLSSREDMQRLARELPNLLACREVHTKVFLSCLLSANVALS